MAHSTFRTRMHDLATVEARTRLAALGAENSVITRVGEADVSGPLGGVAILVKGGTLAALLKRLAATPIPAESNAAVTMVDAPRVDVTLEQFIPENPDQGIGMFLIVRPLFSLQGTEHSAGVMFDLSVELDRGAAQSLVERGKVNLIPAEYYEDDGEPRSGGGQLFTLGCGYGLCVLLSRVLAALDYMDSLGKLALFKVDAWIVDEDGPPEGTWRQEAHPVGRAHGIRPQGIN